LDQYRRRIYHGLIVSKIQRDILGIGIDWAENSLRDNKRHVHSQREITDHEGVANLFSLLQQFRLIPLC
jgi:hypothetical protein